MEAPPAAPQVAPARVPRVRVAPYQARPGRRVLVALDLGDLRGPVTGPVELPLRLFWSGTGATFDLGDPGTRQWVYETVLQEASRPEDLTSFLDGQTLIALWPKLFVPKGVRRAWQDEHPVLRTAVAAAA
ncbi:MAG TPA: hypothetical protein VIJ82_05945 [Streptosporangiaceae bacterium]